MKRVLWLFHCVLAAQLINPRIDTRLPADIDMERESADAQSHLFENDYVRVWQIQKPAAHKELFFKVAGPTLFILSSNQAFMASTGPVTLRNSGYRVDLKFKETQERNDPQDALKSAPASHRLIFENNFVRVLNVTVPPGTKEPMHTHAYPGFFLRDAIFMALRYHAPDGKYKESRRQPKPAKPTVLWLDPEPLHAVENIDTITTPAIRVELKLKR